MRDARAEARGLGVGLVQVDRIVVAGEARERDHVELGNDLRDGRLHADVDILEIKARSGHGMYQGIVSSQSSTISSGSVSLGRTG